MKTQTLHMRVGSNMGTILHEIAYNKLMKDFNLKEATKVFTDSCYGMDDAQALKLLMGTKVLIVDEEKQELTMVDRDDTHKEYASFNVLDYHRTRAIYLSEEGKVIHRNVVKNRNLLSYNSNMYVRFDLQTSYKIYTKQLEPDEVFEEVFDQVGFDAKTTKLVDLMRTVANYFGEVVAYKKFLKEFNLKPYKTTYDYWIEQIKEILEAVDSIEVEDDLSKYLRAAREIEETLKVGIKPVDMSEGFDAGWLSPEGDYYGLNGEIANMLHNQIADALIEAKIIPEDLGDAINETVWLESQGWVKQHGNWILYDGGRYKKRLTKEQIQSIYKFGQLNHNGLLALGFSKEPVSAVRFEMSDPIMLNKKYFNL